MQRKPRTTRQRTRQSVLEVRVMSPRIAWLGFLRFTGKLLKLACLLAVLAAIGWGIWRGIEHTFHENPDFSLKIIDLNPNPVIDEIGLVELAGIDLAAEPSLFDIQVDATQQRLQELPAVIEARVERHLPGTLVVRVTCRNPKAWVAETGTDLSDLRRPGGLLLDPDGYVYPCPERQIEIARHLPLVMLSAIADHPVTSGQALEHPELLHCFNLLTAVEQADPKSPQWIESVRQVNDWSLRLVTRQRTSATFGLTNHPAQIDKLRAALDHAAKKGYLINTINLIPKFNVPITLQRDNTAPRAIPVREDLSSLPPRH